MGGNPRAKKVWEPRPSPLAKVQLTRPISQNPSMGLVRDPMFWKRFSRAVHMTEDKEKEKEKEKAPESLKKTGTLEINEGDEWLVKQNKKKRRCRIICIGVTLAVGLLIGGAIVLALFAVALKKKKQNQQTA